MNPLRILLAVGLGVALALAFRLEAFPSREPAVQWVAQLHGVARLDDGAVALVIPSADPVHGIALDARRKLVWVCAGERLLSYGFDGHQRSSTRLDAAGSPVGIALDTRHAQLWLAYRDSLAVHAMTGERLATLPLPGARRVHALGYDSRRDEVWVSTDDTLRRFAPSGAQVASVSVGRAAARRVTP